MSVPAGYPALGTANPLGLGRVSRLVLRLTKAHDQRYVRLMSASQHSTNEYPYSPALGSSSGLPLRAPNGLRPSGPRIRAFHDARVALAGRPASWGLFVPSRWPRIRFRFLRRPTSDTPVAPPSLSPPRFCRVVTPTKAAKIASTLNSVTRSELSRPEVPSLGRRLVTPRDHFRSPIANRHRHRDVAHRAAGLRLRFTHVIPRGACGTARLPLVRGRDEPLARVPFSRGLSDVS